MVRAELAAVDTRGSGSVSVPVLSKTIVSTSARRSDRIAAIQRDAAAEQRPAPGDDVDRRNGERQRAWAGDDGYGNGRDDRVVETRPDRKPGQRRRQGPSVHDWRIDAEGAFGHAR